MSCRHSKSSSHASSLGYLHSAECIPLVASLEVLTGVMARDTMIGLAKDLLDTNRFLLEHLGIPISYVKHHFHSGIGKHP